MGVLREAWGGKAVGRVRQWEEFLGSKIRGVSLENEGLDSEGKTDRI